MFVWWTYWLRVESIHARASSRYERRPHADTSGGTVTSSRPAARVAGWRSISSRVA
jgi:hypothetical protein